MLKGTFRDLLEGSGLSKSSSFGLNNNAGGGPSQDIVSFAAPTGTSLLLVLVGNTLLATDKGCLPCPQLII